MRLFLKIFILFFTSISLAQSSSIIGQITDIEYDSEPLAFVNVYLKDTNQGVTSDFDGLYTLDNVASGTYTVVYSFVGYETVEIPHVTVTPDKVTHIDVPMS